MQDARRKHASLAGFEVDVEGLGPDFAGPAPEGREHCAAVAGDDVANLELTEPELGEVVIQPLRQRRVHMDDRAVRLGREEAGRRVVEIVDGVLEILEEGFVAVVLAGFVRDGPHRRALSADAFDRTDPYAVPRHAALARRGRREPQVLARLLAGLCRLRQTVDRFGHVGRPGEHPLDGAQFAAPGQGAV